MVKKSHKDESKNLSSVDVKKGGAFLDAKLLLKVLPILLVLIVMGVAFFVRSGPISLSGLDERVEANVYLQIQSLIAAQIDQEYPNLNDAYRQELVAKEYQKVVDSGEYVFNGEVIVVSEIVAKNAEAAKDAFRAENNQTYLNAIDPYYYLRVSTNVLKTGTQGDVVVDGVGYDIKRVAPSMTEVGKPEFHTWLEAVLFKVSGLDESSSVGERTKVIFLIPVVFAMLSVIPIFLILRKFTEDGFAFLGSLLLVTIGTFVSRTIAGFVDTDAYNVFFPLLIVAFLVYGFVYWDRIWTGILSILAGLFMGMYLWAWNSGWFIFAFIVGSLIAYVGYLVLVVLISKDDVRDFYDHFVNVVITAFGFIFSAYLFSWVFAGVDIFKATYGGIVGGISKGIGGVSALSIWPNVGSSVAELNPASFGAIVDSVGGKIVFLIAMLGLVFLTIDFEKKYEKFGLYNKLLVLASILWFVAIVVYDVFVGFTANSALLFLVILFVPVGVGLVFALINQSRSEKVFLSIFLSVWVAGTVFMSFNGVRFILLLAPAFAISFGFGLFYLAEIVNNFFRGEFGLKGKFTKKGFGYVTALILFVILFVPMFNSANAISKGTLPNFDDSWYEAMDSIRLNSTDDAIITSWWDFGHFFIAVADRGTTFDGGSQEYPQSYWVGKLLMESDEEVSHDILQMLVCGGNDAFDKMKGYVGSNLSSDDVKIVRVIDLTFGHDNDETREILLNNGYFSFSSEQVDDVMSSLACESPRENFLITSEDMVGKAGVWAHWGSWDFNKKYVYDNYKVKSVEQMALDIDVDEVLVSGYVEELKAIDVKAQVENVKRKDLVNRWFADYPGFVPIENEYVFDCKALNSTLVCENSIVVNLTNGKVSSSFGKDVVFNKLVALGKEGDVRVVEQNPAGDYDVVLVPTALGYGVLMTQSPLGDSLFTKLFYLDGAGLKYFEKFDEQRSVTGDSIIVWKVNWE